MKFGVREICEVVLRAKSKMQIGSRTFYRNEPVIYFDTLTASSLEGAATTAYANGGRGNARLMAWEGERTMTFNMTDALMSPEGFMILSGAGLVEASNSAPLYVHTTSQVEVLENNTIILPDGAVCWSHSGEVVADRYNAGADIFVMVLKNGEISNEPCIPAENGVTYGTIDKDGVFTEVTDVKTATATKVVCYNHGVGLNKNDIVLVDYYVKRTSGVQQIEITPDKFGGYFYLEAATLFRRESDGKDLPAEFIIPKCKIQSSFTFSMASTGDPSTFDFVLDAFPDYTKFDGTKKVLAALQIVDAASDGAADDEEVRKHCVKVDGKTNVAAEADFVHESGYTNLEYKDGYRNEADTRDDLKAPLKN